MSKALNDFIFNSKYARFIPELGRKETQKEANLRIFKMHEDHLTKNYSQIFESADFMDYFLKARDFASTGKVFGSQRALQFGGKPILKHNAKIYNCTTSYCDRWQVFKEIEYLLLCGCGVGISVQNKHISNIPTMSLTSTYETKTFIIPDEIEGWALAVDELMRHYWLGTPLPVFDYSEIRPKGSMISGGFKAPGPDGLRASLDKIRDVLEIIKNRDGILKPIEAGDIICHLADSVLSGGVRRSAISMIFSPDDEEMMNAKIGSWWYNNPHRARSNNSAILDRDTTKKELFNKLFKSTSEFGEPGFVFASDPDIMFNPCFEIGMRCYDDITGETGWSFCNLCSISGKDIKTEEEFYEACEAASTIGTIQASYNKFPFLTKATENIVNRDALLGVSISGVMTNTSILLNEAILETGAEIIKEVNSILSKILGINEAVRTTCVKPELNN